MNEKQHQWIAFAIIAVVLSAISIFLGVTYPVPPAPAALEVGPNDIVSLGTAYFKNLSITGNELIDGAADAVQLTIQGYTTQTQNLLVVENSAGTDRVTVSNAGDLYVADDISLVGNIFDAGSAVTIFDNLFVDSAADTNQLTVHGYITQTNSLLVLEQSNNSDVFTVANNGNTVVGGTMDVAGASLNYGPNDLYPLGVDTSGFEVVWGSDTITGTLAVTHGLTGPVNAGCTMGATPVADAAMCTVTIAGGTVTVKVWKTDFTTAGSVGALVYWFVIGTP